MTQLLEQLSGFVGQNVWIGFLVAFLAGILSSFTPCSLSSVPLVVAYTGGYSENRRRAFGFSLIFCLGMTVVFVAFGVLTALLGKTVLYANSLWYVLLGVLMAAMTLQCWGAINILPKKCGVTPAKRKGWLGAFFTGVLGAVFASPCATPVLVAILAVVAAGQSVAVGAVMLLLYSLGHSILLVVAGTFVGFVKQLNATDRFARVSRILNIVLGFLLFFLSLYLFYSAFA